MVRRTKALGPAQGRQSHQPGHRRETALPGSIFSSQKPSSAEKGLSGTAFPPRPPLFCLSSRKNPSMSRAGLRPTKRPAAGRRPISSSFRICRKEIVLLKVVQKQFGNIVNGWEAQTVLPAQRESRLGDEKGNKNGLWRNSLTVCITTYTANQSV